MITATRRLQFCAGHRVYRHESKCANVHGHNYVLFFEAKQDEYLSLVETTSVYGSDGLDRLGRVIDFSVMKQKLGAWIEEKWDHGFLFFSGDEELRGLYTGVLASHKHFEMPYNPTAENMAKYLLTKVCPELFANTGVTIVSVTIHETENCSAKVEL